MNTVHLALAERIAARFQLLPLVEAIAIAGSQAAGQAGAGSDIDIYIYTRAAIPAAERLAIGREFSSDAQIIDYWGPGMEWTDPATGLHVDTVYFDTDWMADQVARVLDRHEAWTGYTTAFWHTVRISHILFDRQGWLAALQHKASAPYPDELVRAIVQHNFPLLRDLFPAYLHQIEKAAQRRDWVSLNHRVAALLASYFDILFAINRLPHPGEKRLLEIVETTCPIRPVDMRSQVENVIRAAPESIVEETQILIGALETLLKTEGWL